MMIYDDISVFTAFPHKKGDVAIDCLIMLNVR